MRKTPLALASIAAAALALTVIPAQAADNPGLVPTSDWNSGLKNFSRRWNVPRDVPFGFLDRLAVVADSNRTSHYHDAFDRRFDVGMLVEQFRDVGQFATLYISTWIVMEEISDGLVAEFRSNYLRSAIADHIYQFPL